MEVRYYFSKNILYEDKVIMKLPRKDKMLVLFASGAVVPIAKTFISKELAITSILAEMKSYL